MAESRNTRLRFAGLALLILVVAGGYWLWRKGKAELPEPGSARYEEYAEAFEVGTAALDADRFQIARENLDRAIEMVPREPAAWANRGLLYLRNNELDDADRDLKRAAELSAGEPEIEALRGLLAERRGAFDQAASHLRIAVERRPQDLAAKFALAQVIAKAAGENSEAEYQKLMEDILRAQPNNLKVLVEHAGVAARRRDAAALKDTLARLGRLAPGWSKEAREQLQSVEKAAAGALPGDVLVELVPFGNVLQAERGYNRDSIAVNPKSSASGESVQQFLKLRPLRTAPDAPDTGLTLTPGAPENLAADVARQRWDIALSVWLTGEGPPALFVANAQTVRRADGPAPILPFPSGPRQVPPTADGVLAIDWNNDFHTDLLLAGAGGLKFWQQGNDGTFSDVTAKTGLDAAILQGDYVGAWAADYEMDGDLDIIVAPRTGPPLVLRNNLDDTFTVVKPFPGVEGARAFVWADFDNDGACDAAFLDAQGRLFVFGNDRAGQFHRREVPADLGRLLALTAADVNDDGVFDLLALRDDGAIVRVSDQERGQGWQSAEVARWADLPGPIDPGAARIIAADLDNNGMPDLIVTGPRGSRVWLGEGPDRFTPLAAEIAGRMGAVEDFAGQGRLDAVALSDAGQPLRLINRGTKEYHWQALRPFANLKAEGDGRINSFGIGGEMELRAGTLIQKVRMTSPRIHFGLGQRKKGQIVRIVWPNGFAQLEFLEAGQTLLAAEQRLSGSCPFLFAWNGREMGFVTDFLWSSPLGMYINGQAQGGFAQTEDWSKIRGDQLVPRDGYYDLRVHANLWETHFFDHVALIAVDHPANTEIFVDERFALTPMTPQIYLTGPARPVARATDDRGADVTEIVRKIDGRYLDTFGRGQYQGITRDHWVEVELGEDAPLDGPLWLLATGWIHPTDSSINVAIGQGRHDAPQPLVVEVPDGRGGWKASGPPFGFPAGKNKTMMFRLDGLGRRVRLRTNMEIYWDALQYAAGRNANESRQQRLAPETAELRYRGMLDMTQANASSPELPHYDRVAKTAQPWRDLIGFHTRFGDVRELLAAVDDRYAILNAGDEIALRFQVPDGPPAGWKRDFVWIGDGWEKDGNLNTAFSKTVLPLPSHDLKNYNRPPGRLEDDPVYRRFPDDWRKYHTRYVTPQNFEQGLRSFRRAGP